MRPSIHIVVGMGVPSKNLDFPELSLGKVWTVTLKRARRVRPQSTKKARRRWSIGVRRPMEKAATAGETPKDIYICHTCQYILGSRIVRRVLSGLTRSARESNS
jgi:hypothetical protein